MHANSVIHEQLNQSCREGSNLATALDLTSSSSMHGKIRNWREILKVVVILVVQGGAWEIKQQMKESGGRGWEMGRAAALLIS